MGSGRRRLRRALALAAFAALPLPACVYFNTLYNAERLFEEAERARARGDLDAADLAYREAAQKAAKGLHSDPDGAWADDALYLLARARFGRGNEQAARAALEQLLLTTDDDGLETGAHAYLGAIRVGSGHEAAALAELDAVLRQARVEPELAAFARVWRARARFALGDEAGAWDDLNAATTAGGARAREAWLEMAGRAVAGGEVRRARVAFAELLGDPDAHRLADTLRTMAERAFVRWDARTARGLLRPAAEAPWPPGVRDGLSLYRAELAAAAGDTAAALAEAAAVAARGAIGTADHARVLAARWQLAAASDGELDDVRALLLPAVADPDARTLLRSLEMFEALTERAYDEGQELALFAAAELARDALHAPALAGSLFLAYADSAPDALWAPKALLAAAALELPAARRAKIRARLAAYEGNVYLQALAGRERANDRFRDAETRLASGLATIRGLAADQVQRRDAAIAYAMSAGDDPGPATPDTAAAECAVQADSALGLPLPAGVRPASCPPSDSAGLRCTPLADSLLVGRRCPPADSLAPDTIGSTT